MLRDLTIRLLDAMPQEQLVLIADGPNEASQSRAAARMALVRRYGCADCGAQPGRECKPEYGCANASRRLAPDALTNHLEAAFRAVCEAEALAYAGGMRSTIGADLVTAHSAILSARNNYAAQERRRVAAVREP